jgi:flagellar motor switch protein FliG
VEYPRLDLAAPAKAEKRNNLIMDPGQPDSAIPQDFSRFTNAQKLAGLLLLLDPENAAQILKQLDEHQLEAVSSEMTKFSTISRELQNSILNEFSGVVVEAVSAVSVKSENVQNLLEKSVGLFRASDIMGRVMPTRAPVSAMQRILEMDARHIFNQLRHEQPQTIALIASYLTPEKSSQLLSMMRPELRDQIVERLAGMSPTSVEVVENVVEVLHRKFANNRIRTLNRTGGAKAAAQVLNALPKPVSKSILVSLKERNPELSQTVLQKMFGFEDLERLDAKILQKILQTVESRTLTVALKTASEKLSNKLLSCLSKRAAESVREEISFLGPLKVREIEAAQTQIIEVVRQLESEGEIDLEEVPAGAA